MARTPSLNASSRPTLMPRDPDGAGRFVPSGRDFRRTARPWSKAHDELFSSGSELVSPSSSTAGPHSTLLRGHGRFQSFACGLAHISGAP
jgi:hypothetical protein